LICSKVSSARQHADNCYTFEKHDRSQNDQDNITVPPFCPPARLPSTHQLHDGQRLARGERCNRITIGNDPCLIMSHCDIARAVDFSRIITRRDGLPALQPRRLCFENTTAMRMSEDQVNNGPYSSSGTCGAGSLLIVAANCSRPRHCIVKTSAMKIYEQANCQKYQAEYPSCDHFRHDTLLNVVRMVSGFAREPFALMIVRLRGAVPRRCDRDHKNAELVG
jgi:hypothetical protein